MIISEMQHKLATWASADQTRRFDRLLRLITDRNWLAEAARINVDLGERIVQLAEELPEAVQLMRGRTFARAVH